METIGAFDAKTNLGRLLDRVERGEEVTITRHGRPVAKLVPVAGQKEDEINQAIDWLLAFRRSRRGRGMSREEILAARDEGRRGGP